MVISLDIEFKFISLKMENSLQDEDFAAILLSLYRGNLSEPVNTDSKQTVKCCPHCSKEYKNDYFFYKHLENKHNFYIVEAVLEHKKIENKTLYHIKWEGYDKTTWEPSTHLPMSVLNEYNKKISQTEQLQQFEYKFQL